jgi:hypothetical protein
MVGVVKMEVDTEGVGKGMGQVGGGGLRWAFVAQACFLKNTRKRRQSFIIQEFVMLRINGLTITKSS